MATGFPVKANYATGDVLTAANMNDLSGTVNYLQYMPPRNPVLNSNFSVWQRGTSIAVAASTQTYNADRWQLGVGANEAFTVSRQATGDTTNLPNIQYCARVQRNSGQTGTATITYAQTFETVNSIPFAGKQATISFYARAGANYSSASNNLTLVLYSGTGTDQNLFSGFTGVATPISQNSTLTTTWQRFTYTGTIAATATQLSLGFLYIPVGTAGANDYFEVTGVQLELGSVANTYMPNQPTYQGELAACQRYYFNFVNGNNFAIGVGSYENATSAMCGVQFPVTMRTAPTLSATSGTDYYRAISSGGGSDNFNSFTIVNASTTAACIYNNSEISGTAGQACRFISTNASSFVSFVSEL